MNWKSYTLMSGAGALATWLAAAPPAATPGGTVAEQPTASSMAALTSAAADVEAQAARLHAGLRQQTRYRQPLRDPFRFAAPQASMAEMVEREAAEAPLVDEEPQPSLPLRLAGIAVDQDVRTAVLSTPAGVVLAVVGDEVLARFRVSFIGDDAVELIRISDGAAVLLSF